MLWNHCIDASEIERETHTHVHVIHVIHVHVDALELHYNKKLNIAIMTQICTLIHHGSVDFTCFSLFHYC